MRGCVDGGIDLSLGARRLDRLAVSHPSNGLDRSGFNCQRMTGLPGELSGSKHPASDASGSGAGHFATSERSNGKIFQDGYLSYPRLNRRSGQQTLGCRWLISRGRVAPGSKRHSAGLVRLAGAGTVDPCIDGRAQCGTRRSAGDHPHDPHV